MEKLERMFPTLTTEPWTGLNLSGGLSLNHIPYHKVKGKQYARPFYVGIKPMTKKQIKKMFKKIINNKKL